MNERNHEVPHDTEDKGWWLQHGEELEFKFVKLCNEHLNLEAKINPAKLRDATCPDLIVDGVVSDLKVQNTPFFTAGRYGMEPRNTITFNRKDYERYCQLYPNIGIYVWVDWKQTQYRGISIEHLAGVFHLPFSDLAKLIESPAPEHRYINRMSDTRGNAKSSFLLDLREFTTVFASA